MEQFVGTLVIFERMDSKSIALTCDEHHFMKRFYIVPAADRHAFFLGQADVITSLLFHSCKDFFFGIFYINNDSMRRLDIMRRGLKCYAPPFDFAQGRSFRFLIIP